MPTHAIGSGTANLSINVPIDERALWGRLAFQAIERGEARSVGDYERKVMAAGLAAMNPEAAARLREIRSRYYAAALAALLFVPFLSSWLGFRDEQAARRSSSRVRIVRVIRSMRGPFGDHYELEASA